ncbi:DUF3455 domain-containing protein [Roseisolibacter agri]|uniref:DUF3455 domain-containing protein n=1 Tax=Roseisolibacter agri TaxID=2014610 RepID=A0AA37QHJ3_9BACT|nr:DUF3455 domain-containing protein [Roseisolibacter agri]GLC26958.1 hypothetical protein rosag_34710 [Roseisolibacter agri]
MHSTRWHRTAHAMRVAAIVASAAACGGERTLGPREAPAFRRGVDLGACGQLRAPEGSVVAAHLYARGVQIYRWNGASWAFEGPSAALYADAGFTGQVGTHFAGPTWVHAGGSTVRGASPVACTVDADAIPWLLLRATPESHAGIFGRVVAIQRVNTVGGRAPGTPGTAPGEVRQVPYTAEYYFYR